MSIVNKVLAVLLVALLLGCGSTSDAVQTGSGVGADDIAPEDSAEDLYFELMRLESAGLLPSGRMDAVQRALNELDDSGKQDSEEHREQQRAVLVSFLNRTRHEARQGEDAAVLAAWDEGRGYARKLNRAGVHEAERYAENTVLIAGMMGVPTGKEDLVLMVAIPVGGYVVVKAGGMAFRRVAFLMRKLRTVDDVVEHAQAARGFSLRYATSEAELRQVAGDAAADTVLRTELHVGASSEASRRGKENVWNPSRRKDNCTACVATVIRNSMEGYFRHSADDMERLFGYAGRERQFTVDTSLRYIEKATGLKATSEPVPMIGGNAVVGHYAIFVSWKEGQYQHVVYGRVTPTGRVTVFDPQSMEHMTYEQMLKNYGRARPFRLESAR